MVFFSIVTVAMFFVFVQDVIEQKITIMKTGI
jgi:hypothetical protein